MSREELPVAEFAFPGPLRDQLVAAILSGGKTTTTGLLADYELKASPCPARACGKQWLTPPVTRQVAGRPLLPPGAHARPCRLTQACPLRRWYESGVGSTHG